MLTTKPRGTKDILPEESSKWQALEKILCQISKEYGFQEIRTPIFEHTELFQRGVGETTDIVEKEMYSFTDRGDRSITLRPEGTASTVRAYLENKLYAGAAPTKLFYIGPMFRYDRPQAGRYRQFHQFGVEVFGSNEPIVDAEVIAMAVDFYERIGLTNLEVHINSVGCPSCRLEHRKMLQEFLKPKLEDLCNTCSDRFDRNPLRILDCKNPKCQELGVDAPTTLTSLCPECAKHFQKVKDYLDEAEVNYTIDEKLVRGLDYYTNTAFEIHAPRIGAQSALGGGGRYNGLIEQCGGPSTPGIGYALGLERILLVLDEQGIELGEESSTDIFVAGLGSSAKKFGFKLVNQLRKAQIKAEQDLLEKGLKAQLKQADRYQVKLTVIIGEEELNNNYAVVRNMKNSQQENIPLEELANYIHTKLREE